MSDESIVPAEEPVLDLRTEVDLLRQAITDEKAMVALREAQANDEYQNRHLTTERDRLRAELAGMRGVPVEQIVVEAPPAPEQPVAVEAAPEVPAEEAVFLAPEHIVGIDNPPAPPVEAVSSDEANALAAAEVVPAEPVVAPAQTTSRR